jgi:hypothetical protein
MINFFKRLGLITGLGLTAIGAPLEVRAQLIRPGFHAQGPISLNQAAFNQAMTGQVHPFMSPVSAFPFANPLFNPAANPIANPFANPAINPAINPGAIANFFSPSLAFQANPLTNPFTNPLTNPQVAAALTSASAGTANPYASYANPYTSASTMNSGSSSPYSSSYETPIGGFMKGGADIVSSQGRWMKDLQQAGLTTEQVRQSKLNTGRKYFDEYYYERRNTPTFEEERQFFNNQQLLHSLNNPRETEIWSGQALNDILADVAKLDKDQTARARSILLDEDDLRHINLTSGAGGGNAGLLKNDARFTWPLALRDEVYKADREVVNALAPEAVHQVVNGRVDAGTLRELSKAAERLRHQLAVNIRDMSANQYTDASRFLGHLDGAVRTLGRPDAGDYFSPKYAPQGKDVCELVRNLNAQGLRFAPATPGDEAAYVALHRALAAYRGGAQATVASETEPNKTKPAPAKSYP